uniref:AlNc14C290G10230 protein n=1 Tax=Albugo laibachii Nc14 TaxID=890382 RepID=F0WV85_9STRA|nr:AlNc14C290G10230 [Albugo laibachii Nc14]|eukprot:CCA25324.1 AlNc14C290G10230 [Albugo laibachii Nc14]
MGQFRLQSSAKNAQTQPITYVVTTQPHDLSSPPTAALAYWSSPTCLAIRPIFYVLIHIDLNEVRLNLESSYFTYAHFGVSSSTSIFAIERISALKLWNMIEIYIKSR